MKEYKEKEIKRLEKIKQMEQYEYNKNIVSCSIDYILDNVDIEIETIEFNKKIQTFDNEINKFQNNITLRKAELEYIKKKQAEEIEYERIQVELYEQEMLKYKENQEKLLLSQMSDMLLQFNINTEEHIKYIEKQKHDAELANIKKKEEEEEILDVMKKNNNKS